MNADQKMAITQVAQQAVDEILQQCRNDGSDPVAALEGAILATKEMIHWAEEAIQQIQKGK